MEGLHEAFCNICYLKAMTFGWNAVFFLNHVCIIQGPGLHIPFMTIDNDMFSCDVQELGGAWTRLTVFDKQLVLWWIIVQDA